jgi:hypothetical protein
MYSVFFFPCSFVLWLDCMYGSELVSGLLFFFSLLSFLWLVHSFSTSSLLLLVKKT